MYSGYLESFYKQYPETKHYTYEEELSKLLACTSEPMGSYSRTFNELGIQTECIITNAHRLQKKWRIEHGFGPTRKNNLVLAQVRELMPDVLWVEGNEYVKRGWIDQVKRNAPTIRLFVGNHCAPFNSMMLENFKNLNFVLTCTPGLKKCYDEHGIRSYLVYHAFDPEILDKIYENNSLSDNDLVFSGSLFTGGGFHNKRIDLLERILTEKIGIMIYGNLEKKWKTTLKQVVYYVFKFLNFIKCGNLIKFIPLLRNYKEYSYNLSGNYSLKLKRSVYPPVFGNEMFKLMNRSKIVLNIHGEVAGEYAGNVRLFEATGVGSCLLTDNKKNLKELFEIGKEIVAFEGIDDCIEKIKWLLTHDEERKIIARAGQQRTLQSHTVEDRCKMIISIISNELESYKD